MAGKKYYSGFLTTVKNIPQVHLRNIPSLMNYYRKTMIETWRESHGGERSQLIKQLMKHKALLANRAYEGKDVTFEDEIDRMAYQFQMGIRDNSNAPYAIRKLKNIWDWLEKSGRFSDKWGKIAAAKYMLDKSSKTPEEIYSVIRNRVGTPNVKRRGTWNRITIICFCFPM